MALYDNKLWLLSHIRTSFISTDDTGMSEFVMVSEDIPKDLADRLDTHRDPDDSEDDEDDISRDLQLDMEFAIYRQRLDTAGREHGKRRPPRRRNIKWELAPDSVSSADTESLFSRKEFAKKEEEVKEPARSMLTKRLIEGEPVKPNPFGEYARFDGTGLLPLVMRRYRIFLTMLPLDFKNYPMHVVCIASATVEELTGFILLKFTTTHSEYPIKSLAHYGLYITEEDGEVDRDFPALDPDECIAKFGFNNLGLVEYKDAFDKEAAAKLKGKHNGSTWDALNSILAEEAKQLSLNMQMMKVHAMTMEAPLYQSYRVYIVNKVRAKAEVHLGISGEKIEIDPLQPRNPKLSFVRLKPVTHHMDSIACCDITDTRSTCTTFRVVYSPSFGNSSVSTSLGQSPTLQSSTSFKHYDFEADHNTAEEVVQKINLILELRSSVSRKEYLTRHERKHKKKTSNYNK